MLIFSYTRKQDHATVMIPMSLFPSSRRLQAQRPEPPSHSKARYEVWLVLLALTVLYAVIVSFASRRLVWFDELLTLDIANANTIPRMWEIIRRIDFQPPLGYLFSRFSMQMLGQTPLGLRFPSMLEFYVASLAIFFYVRRKAGNGYAASTLLIMWMGQTRYATEARPYALLLMFFSILLLSWEVATTSEKRNLALWGTAFSNAGMICAHVFGVLSLFPFLAAELARFSRTRKPDLRLWAALLFPVAAVTLYVPLVAGYGALSFPPAFQASVRKILHFYNANISGVSVALFFALCAALIVQARPRIGVASALRREEPVLFGCMFLIPALLNLLLMRRHGAFWVRYAITTEAAIYIAMAVLLSFRLGRDRSAGYAAAAVLLIFCIGADVWGASSMPVNPNASVLASIRSDLPLVDAGGVTYFEMNHHEKQIILSRLYFLKDREAALRYTNTNLFEDRVFANKMDPSFHISARVEPYNDFIREHREFLVLGTYDAPEEWLLRKLKDDGARLTWLGTFAIPYVDGNLYLVDLAGAQ
jgi:hypothetical protein